MGLLVTLYLVIFAIQCGPVRLGDLLFCPCQHSPSIKMPSGCKGSALVSQVIPQLPPSCHGGQ